MMPKSLWLGAACLLASGAHADPRITTHFYQSSEVVEIHGRDDTQSTIAFAPDERIENIAVGDSAGWQVAPNKRADLLFLKPVKPGARTNMTVVTDQRTYLFDLVAAPRAQPIYMLRFTYPVPPAKPAPVVAAATPAPSDVQKTAAADPLALDFAWISHGDKALLPDRIFDDGHSTFLAWPKDVPLPAILTAEGKGAEGPVNYTSKGEFIVVDGVPAQLILRSGRQVATLTQAHGALADDDGRARAARRKTAPALRPGPPYATFASSEP
jgi:type IV secretion system protein VirB9